MPIYKTDIRKDGKQQYRVRINYTTNDGKYKQIERSAYGLAEAKDIETAVTNVLNAGYRTKDIYNGVGEVVGTKEMGDLIAKEI